MTGPARKHTRRTNGTLPQRSERYPPMGPTQRPAEYRKANQAPAFALLKAKWSTRNKGIKEIVEKITAPVKVLRKIKIVKFRAWPVGNGPSLAMAFVFPVCGAREVFLPSRV